jgi:type IV secretory pathway TrbL component
MGALDIVGESLIFLALCWFVPKIVAGVLGGSPAFTGGEIIAVATPIAYGAVMAAQSAVSLASSGIGALAGAGPGCGRCRNGQRRAARSSRTARHEWRERLRRPTCAPAPPTP